MRGSTFCGINMEAETACQDVRKILNKLQELHNGFGSETVAGLPTLILTSLTCPAFDIPSKY